MAYKGGYDREIPPGDACARYRASGRTNGKTDTGCNPVGLFRLSVILTNHHGPYFLRKNSTPTIIIYSIPSVYLKFHTPGHTDHPGTTLQILGAAALLLKWLGAFLIHRQSLTDSILSQPEEYLRVISVVLNVLIGGTLYWSAWCVYRLSNSLIAAALLQGSVLV
jgi:hypothetical protein